MRLTVQLALSLLDAGKTYPSNKSPTTIQRLYWGKDARMFLRSTRLEHAWLPPDKPGCLCLGMTREPSLVTGESCAQAHCGSVEPGAVRLCLRTQPVVSAHTHWVLAPLVGPAVEALCTQ